MTTKHIIVEALAGTGKTTTIEWALRGRAPKGLKPSDEQKAIMDSVRDIFGMTTPAKRKKRTKAIQAFNKSMGIELEERMSDIADCRTCNSFGHRAWAGYIKKRLQVDGWKTRQIFRELGGEKIPYRTRIKMEGDCDQIIAILKNNYRPQYGSTVDSYVTAELIDEICDRFNIMPDHETLEYIPKVFLEGIENPKWQKTIDYNDQLFLPLWFGIDLPQYDIMGVDEAQDLNPSKQEMAFRMGLQLMVIGDSNQAIYGFAGADSRSIANMREVLGGSDFVLTLPLNTTRRCSRAVVEEANRYVPALVAHEDNTDGSVGYIPHTDLVKECLGHDPSSPEKMILCTTNAPITKLAFQLIAQKVRCFIQGRDIGAALKRRITETGCYQLSDALVKADENFDKQVDKLSRAKFVDDEKIQAVRDQQNCLHIVADPCSSVQEFKDSVDNMFKDSGRPGDIRLSSGHKSKGLEADDVYILKPENVGVPFKRRDPSPMDIEQARNLAYVMITRSKNRLSYVETPAKEENGDFE